MAKNSIRDYSATNSSNTDIQSIDISEGCSPAGINNAIREVMADLKDVSTGAVALESPAFDSASLTGDLTFGDNDKAIFGAGSDLQIYHTGTQSIIEDVGTGPLRIRSNFISIENELGTETISALTQDGAVTIYYNGSPKIATSATGVDVTGTVTADGLTVDTNTLYVDSTNNRVGIGTTSPASIAHIKIAGTTGTNLLSLENGSNKYDFRMSGNDLYIRDGADDRITLTSGGNVGIGTSSPSSNAIVKFLEIEDATSAGLVLDAPRIYSIYSSASSTLEFRDETASANRMSIDSSGNVLIGVAATGNNGAFFSPSSNDRTVLFLGTSTTSTSTVQAFRNSNGTVGTISVGGSATSYNTSSDYRLKENVTADWDATTRLKQLNPVRFNFISDADTTVDGFLAHEVQDIVPEAITGTKDAMMDEEYEVSAATGDIYTPAVAATYDDDGNEVTPAVAEVIHSTDVERPEELAEGQQWRETTAAVMGTRSVPDYQGIDQSKLVPLLVKTIQELEARVAALENA